MKFEKIKVKEIAEKMNNDYVNHDAAQMLYEISPLIDTLDIPEAFIYKSIEAALDVYYETEYATTTGFGIVVGTWLAEHCDPRKTYTHHDLCVAFKWHYNNSDWR